MLDVICNTVQHDSASMMWHHVLWVSRLKWLSVYLRKLNPSVMPFCFHPLISIHLYLLTNGYSWQMANVIFWQQAKCTVAMVDRNVEVLQLSVWM